MKVQNVVVSGQHTNLATNPEIERRGLPQGVHLCPADLLKTFRVVVPSFGYGNVGLDAPLALPTNKLKDSAFGTTYSHIASKV